MIYSLTPKPVEYSCTRICISVDDIDGLFQPPTLKIGMHVAVDSIKVCTKGFPVRSLRSAPEIRSSSYSAQMRAPLNLEYLRGEASPHKILWYDC